jgi:hypothetical protein
VAGVGVSVRSILLWFGVAFVVLQVGCITATIQEGCIALIWPTAPIDDFT